MKVRAWERGVADGVFWELGFLCCRRCRSILNMAVVALNPGVVVRLQDIQLGSPFVLPNQSLRVVGFLQSFDAASGIAILTDAGASLRIDLEHLRALALRVGSLFEFIGELVVDPLQELTLKARVGRNVDGMDMKIFDKVLQLRRRFEKEFTNH